MILFIIFFTGHLVIILCGRAHYNYAKFHCNHHRVQVQMITWSLREFSIENCSLDIVHHLFHWSLGHLVTWSLGHLVTWSVSHLVINLYGRAHHNYAIFHYNHHTVQLVTWSLVTWSLVTWSLVT
jgi:hypothetical protein